MALPPFLEAFALGSKVLLVGSMAGGSVTALLLSFVAEKQKSAAELQSLWSLWYFWAVLLDC